jgi:predicted O-methyltransferase YrrM
MLFLDYLRNTECYKLLCQVHDSNEGNTLEIIDDRTAEAQVEFHRWAWSLVLAEFAEASEVLEVGHNKGMFGLLFSTICPNGGLTAIDVNPKAAKAAEILNQYTTIDVDFLCGDSDDILHEVIGPFDYAWVDGNHDTGPALADLMHCDRLAIPWVAVDDTAYPSVVAAVEQWQNAAPYTEIPNPFIAADARKARLYRRH